MREVKFRPEEQVQNWMSYLRRRNYGGDSALAFLGSVQGTKIHSFSTGKRHGGRKRTKLNSWRKKMEW
jgi:hypothetical protein